MQTGRGAAAFGQAHGIGIGIDRDQARLFESDHRPIQPGNRQVANFIVQRLEVQVAPFARELVQNRIGALALLRETSRRNTPTESIGVAFLIDILDEPPVRSSRVYACCDGAIKA